MKYNLISNITNGAGLQKDTELLKRMLESYGHTVTCSMFNDSNPTFRQHDINIFLEVVTPQWFPFARENWLVPNSEWWGQCWEGLVPRFTKVLCKTKDCFAIWGRKVGAKAIYTGFEANDFYQPNVTRKLKFLHLAGKSETKNTAAVIAAWRDYHLPYPLIVSAFKPTIMQQCLNVPNVTLVTRFGDEQAQQIMNECAFHIMPSKNEGFGHAIHEALGCKGIVITTNAPPMNEFTGVDTRLLIAVERTVPRPPLTFFYEVNPGALANAVHKAVQMPSAEQENIGNAARAGFLADREYFRTKFEELARA